MRGGTNRVKKVCEVFGEEDAGTRYFVGNPVMKRRYVGVLAATGLPFAREVVSSINPDHRLRGRVSVSSPTEDSGTRRVIKLVAAFRITTGVTTICMIFIQSVPYTVL